MIDRAEQNNEKVMLLVDNIEKIIVGKRSRIELVVAAMLVGGHVLIEDVPGVGKTQLVSALASSCKGEFGRIQMTPDIMPMNLKRVLRSVIFCWLTKSIVLHQSHSRRFWK